MPYVIHRDIGGFEVVNATTGRVHAKHTSRAKAKAQVRLLESLERRQRRGPARQARR